VLRTLSEVAVCACAVLTFSLVGHYLLNSECTCNDDDDNGDSENDDNYSDDDDDDNKNQA